MRRCPSLFSFLNDDAFNLGSSSDQITIPARRETKILNSNSFQRISSRSRIYHSGFPRVPRVFSVLKMLVGFVHELARPESNNFLRI